VEECTYFWGVNTSWGINTAESKRPLNQEDNHAPQPTWWMWPQVYLENRGVSVIGVPIMEPKQWIQGIYNTCIMKLLEIPHFGRGKDVNNCIKQLVVVMHRGILWLDTKFSIDFNLIKKITGLPTNGEPSAQYLDEKTKEKSLEEEMKKTYGT
jgi:hypothetical protein